MYRKCVTEVSVRNQRKLEDSLLELMLKYPYEEITVTRLCQTAELSRRVFYHLFSGKTDALHALIDHRILDAESSRTEISDQSLRFVLYWKEQRRLLDALSRNNMGGLLLERLIINVLNEDQEVLYWLKKKGWSHGVDVLVFTLSGMIGLLYSWYFSGYERTPEEMAAVLDRILTTPLGSAGTSQ